MPAHNLTDKEIEEKRAEIKSDFKLGLFFLIVGLTPLTIMIAEAQNVTNPKEIAQGFGMQLQAMGTFVRLPFWPLIGLYRLVCARTKKLRLRYDLLGYGYYQ
jgi:hypothetical protein